MAMSKPIYMVAGRLGVTDGFDIDQTDTIDEHDDGAPSGMSYKVDLSHLLSEQLGKQLDMMSTYRVKYISLNFRNVNDLNDNDYGLFAGGLVNWYSPTKHRIDALQAARQYKRDSGAVLAAAGNASDPFSAFTSEKHYKGLRFNWSGDGDVEAETRDETGILAGTYFSYAEIFDHYNQAIGGTPAEEGRPTGGEGMALWNSRTGVGEYESLYWATYIRNSGLSDDTIGVTFNFEPEVGQWTWQSDANHLPVLGGLMEITVHQTNTDNPRAAEVEDDYNVECVIGVEGWSDF